MTPVDQERRHCSSCDRVITDFSKMSDDELMLFFRHSNGKICGRFARHQLDRPMPLLPQKTQPAKWWRTLLLLPLTLFGKSARAQNDSAAQVVTKDTLVVSADSTLTNTLVDSTVATAHSDSTEADSLPQAEYAKKKQQKKSGSDHSQPKIEIIHIEEDIIMGATYIPSQPDPGPELRLRWNEWSDVPGGAIVLSADSAFQNVTTENPQKSADPHTPAQSSDTTDLSAVLPEKRRRFWRS